MATAYLRRARSVLSALSLVALSACGAGAPSEVVVHPDAVSNVGGRATGGPSNLQTALASHDGPVRFVLSNGHYFLEPSEYEDPLCANCADPTERVPATLGLRVSGRGIELVGANADSVVIHTNAGYGLLFEECENCLLSGVTVTDGVRDPDGRASDAGIVVRASTVRIEECRITENLGDSAVVASVVVGVMGIAGRENSDFSVNNCVIERNSWDGIALFRDARAEIRNNIVDGVDKASGSRVGGGRGVAIGITWNAEAIVEGNLVRRYWKGIGMFVDAHATVRNNIVEDMLTWGIAYWGADSGLAVATIEENVVFQTGACGVLIDRPTGGDEPAGSFSRNAIVRANQNERYDSGEPYCEQLPIAHDRIPDGFVEADNLIHDNRRPDDAPELLQLNEADFREQAAPLVASLRERPALAVSYFLEEFGGR